MSKRKMFLGISVAVALISSAWAGAESGPRLRPKAYGTGQDSIYHVPITEFVPRESSWITNDSWFAGSVARFTTNCGGTCMQAIPRLPDGALLTGIEAYFCNVDPNHNHLLGVQLYRALYDGTDIQDLGAAVYSSTSNGCGEFVIADLTSLNYQVNLLNNQLLLVARVDDQDGSQAIAGVNLFYRLQISPAPPTADFTDVPTGHPYFQFIEALSGSGITAG